MLETLCVSLMASAKLNLLPNERLESFWDALWLGIRTFLCFKVCKIGTTLGSDFMKIMEDNGRKLKNGPQKRHIDVDLHV